MTDHETEETSSDDLISVCMIVKDGEKYLEKSLDSLLGLGRFELCVILDDRSTDRTADILRMFSHKHSVPLHLKTRKWTNHFADARNASIDLAAGKWVLIWDHDYEFVGESAKNVRECLRINSGSDSIGRVSPGSIDGLRVSAVNYHTAGTPTMQAMELVFRRVWSGGEVIRYANRVHETVNDFLCNRNAKIFDAARHVTVRHFGDVDSNEHKHTRNLELLDLALRENPNDWHSLGHSLIALVGIGRHDKALEIFNARREDIEKACENIFGHKSSRGEHHLALAAAMVLLEAGEAERSLQFSESLGDALDHQCPDVEMLIGVGRLCQGRLTDARNFLERSIILHAHGPHWLAVILGAGTWKSYEVLGKCYELLAKHARETFEKMAYGKEAK